MPCFVIPGPDRVGARNDKIGVSPNLLLRIGFLRVAGLRRVGEFKNHLAGTREAHFFAGDSFDGFGIALQRVDLFGQRLILFVHLADLLSDLFDLHLRAAHGDEAVRAENVVHQQGEKREAQNLPHVAPQILAGVARRNIVNSLQRHLAFASCAESITHACVSLAIFDDSSSVAASVYTRISGSVPESRSRTHDPSANSIFTPSVRSRLLTRRPRNVGKSAFSRLTALNFTS